MPNLRTTDRASFFAEVDVLLAGAAAPRRVWSNDLSEQGIFLQTTHPFRIGDRVSLRFDLKQSEVHVRAAEVMWVRPFEPISVDGRNPGVGVRFVAVDPPARAALRTYVRPHIEPKHDTLLPEEMEPSAPTRAALPRAVTLAPSGALDDDDENPLAGWTFRKADVESSAAPTESTPESSGATSFAKSLHKPFDDDDARTPHADTAHEGGPIPMLSQLEERAMQHGELSLHALPLSSERRPAPVRKNRSAWPAALGLLAAGACAGLVVGFLELRHPPKHDKAAATAKHDVTTTKPAEAVAVAAPAVAPVVTAPVPAPAVAAPAVDTKPVAAVADAKPIDVKPADLKPVDVKPVATDAPADVPVKKTKAQKAAEAKAKAKAAHDEAIAKIAGSDSKSDTPTTTASTTSRKHDAPFTVQKGHLTLASAATDVTRTLVLKDPARIAIDIETTKVPKAALHVDDQGVTRVRFGKVKDGKSRVVIEFEDKAPKGAKATLKDGQLDVTWR